MKTLYLECNMGAAGDMLMAALLELLPKKEEFLEQMNHLGLEGVRVESEPSVKCGITGTHMTVSVYGEEEESLDVLHGHSHEHEEAHEHGHDHGEMHNHDHSHDHDHGEPHEHSYVHDHEEPHAHEHSHAHEHEELHDHAHSYDHEHGEVHAHVHEYDHEELHARDHSYDHAHTHPHHHAGMHEIEHITSHLNVSEKVRRDILAVYRLIAEAESHAHGCPVEQIHFHEVGTRDAVADIAGVCLLMEKLAPERVVVSPVHTGYGEVRCAHGILPVPAPATAWLLRGIPSYGGSVRGELCTPTGAALLRYFADEFGSMPVMRVNAVGYGMGKKDFGMANCLRAMLGESEDRAEDEVLELSCNLDDMTPEAIGFAQEQLWELGALDVFTTAIGMKKNRPAVMLTCLCRLQDRDKIIAGVFRHTTTLGIREHVCRRDILTRTFEKRETALGSITVKKSTGYGVTREKAEYEDIVRLCREHGLSLDELRKKLKEDFFAG